MKKKYVVIIFISIQFVSYNLIFSQTNPNETSYYNWFDNVVGIENTGIFEGFRFDNKIRTKDDNHRFYLTSNFQSGDLIYDNQPYFDKEIKYDLSEDKIIINLYTQSGNSILELISEKVEKFKIVNKEFVRIANNDAKHIGMFTGFYEILYLNKALTIFKKHKKEKRKYIERQNVYYEFKEQYEYFLNFQNKYYNIKSKNDLIKIFPSNKENINTFYDKNKALIKSNYDIFIKEIIKQSSNSISEKSNK